MRFKKNPLAMHHIIVRYGVFINPKVLDTGTDSSSESRGQQHTYTNRKTVSKQPFFPFLINIKLCTSISFSEIARYILTAEPGLKYP